MSAAARWESLRTEAHAWILWTNRAVPIDRFHLWLAADERARLEEIKRPALQNEYLATRVLCRRVLSEYADVPPQTWTFTANSHGKPRIAAPGRFSELRFNLTHTKDLIICLVSRCGEVGIDAEETSRLVDVEEIGRHFLSPFERQALLDTPAPQRSQRFFELWVLKEAYLKARGDGLSRDPASFTVDPRANSPLPSDGWLVRLKRLRPRHVAATAIEAPNAITPSSGIKVRWKDVARLLKTRIPVIK